MKVQVKVFGVLGLDFPGYDPLCGMDVNLPDDARVKDLLAHLDIPKTRGCIVIVNTIVAKPTDKLADGELIQIFQAMAGG